MNSHSAHHILLAVFIAGLLLSGSTVFGEEQTAKIIHGIWGAGTNDIAVLKEIHANAVDGSITNEQAVKELHAAGIEVKYWLHTHPGQFEVRCTGGCVNGQWGKEWADDMVAAARSGVDCINIIPDEYNWAWLYWRRKDQELKIKPSAKAEEQRKAEEAMFNEWKNQTVFCTCADCKRLFKKQYGLEPPATLMSDLQPVMRAIQIGSHDERARSWIKFRYDCTTEWIKNTARRVKEANPKIKMTVNYSLNPLCAARRYEPSVAWDQVGYETELDFAGTDPYLDWGNEYGRGDHYFIPETTVHLVGVSPRTRNACLILTTTKGSDGRRLEDVEVYGSAISAVAHGAREIYYYYGASLYPQKDQQCGQWTEEDARNARQQIKTAFTMLEDIEPWVIGTHKPKDIAFIHSRASEDLYQLFNETEPPKFLVHRQGNSGYGYGAHKEVLRFLLRERYMFDLYYLEQLRYDEVKDYGLLVLPFAFAVDDDKAKVLKRFVQAGGKLLVISEFGMVNELGNPHKEAALNDLLGLKKTPRHEDDTPLTLLTNSPFLAGKSFPDSFSLYSGLELVESARFLATDKSGKGAGIVMNTVGKGQVIFLAGEFGVDLTEERHRYDQRDKRRLRTKAVPPIYNRARYQLMTSAVDYLLGERKSLDTRNPAYGKDYKSQRDVEIVLREKAPGQKALFLINWEHWRNEITVNIRNLPAGNYKVTQRDLDKTGPFGKGVYEAAVLTNLTVSLKPAEVKVLHLVPETK